MQTQSSPQSINLQVTYNGVTKPLEVQPNQPIKSALHRAIHELFHLSQNVHLLGLFFDGVELKDDSSVEDNGLVTGADVQLRPSTVRGG